MSTPTSSPSSGMRKRVVASPRNAQDLKLRLASVETTANGHFGGGMVSPLTELLSSSPSQLQPLTPDVNGRQTASPSTAWSLSANLLSNSSRNNNTHNTTTSTGCNNSSSNAAQLTRSKVPPALDIMSPTTANRQSISGNARGSLPDLATRKEAPPSSSVDVSAERCALSPSSAGGGRSLAFTPTFDTSNNASSVTPQRGSASTLGDAIATPPPNAPRGYAKRGGAGSTNSINGNTNYNNTGTTASVGAAREGAPPPPRPSLGSGLRSNTAPLATALESSPRHPADDSFAQLGTHASAPPRHNVDAMAFARGAPNSESRLHNSKQSGSTGGGGMNYNNNNNYTSSGSPVSDAAEEQRDAPPTLAEVREHYGGATCHSAGFVRPSLRTHASSASPSAPSTPAVGSHGRSAQTNSILATSQQRDFTSSAGPSAALTPTVSGSNHSSYNNRSHDARAKSSRAPRLATHLFLDSAGTPESAGPASGLQSPAMTEAKKRGSRGSSSSRCRTRTSRGSSEGRVSISTESSTVGVSPIFTASRPNALNFARGELIGKGSFGAVYRGMQRNTNRIICMKEIRLPGVVEEELRKMQRGEEVVAEDMSPRGAAASTPPPQPSVDNTGKGKNGGSDTNGAVGGAAAAVDAKEKAALLKQMESVKRELHLLKQLNHPNIVKYLNDEVVDGCLRIYMEYVSGGSVASAVKTYGRFEEPQAAALCYQLLQGLSYLHSRGIVHRDLKGDNLLLETSSELKIADFGTAKSIIASATMTANIVGTAYFMAPEVLRPDGVAGTPADVWSTGCCVIEMLTGKPPLSDIPNQYTVMMTIAGSPTVPLEKYIPADNTWSAEVQDFIQQCLRVNPATRPTVQELLHHPWMVKYCDCGSTDLRGAASFATAATTNSSTTPTMPPMDRVAQQPPQQQRQGSSSLPTARGPTSPDALVTAATPDFAATRTPTASPHPHSRVSSGATPREHRKGKKEKRSMGNNSSGASRRQHSRDATSGNRNSTNANNYSEHSRDESYGTPSPPPGVSTGGAGNTSVNNNNNNNNSSGHRFSGDGPAAPVSLFLNGHPASGKGHTSNSNSNTNDVSGYRNHYSRRASTLSVKDDERQQSFSYDYPLPSPGRLAELTGQSSGTFLPAIPGLSNNNNAGGNVASSVDGLRGGRFARHFNVGSSRDDTRAYQYPNEDEFMRRESTRLAKDFYLDGHDYGRDGADNFVRYGSTTRIPLSDTGLEPGLYSTLDCLTAPPTAEDLAPPAASRRSTSKRAGCG